MNSFTGRNIIITILGKKGSGKSYFVKNTIVPLFPRLLIIDPLDEYHYYYVYSLPEFVGILKENYTKNKFRLVYRPLDENEDLFFKFVFSLENVTLIIEEVDGYANGKQTDKYLEKLFKYGRHKNINLICVSRRPAEIGRLLTAQSDIIISFQQTEGRDIDYFKNFTDNPEVLKNLKVGEFKVMLGENDFRRLKRKKYIRIGKNTKKYLTSR